METVSLKITEELAADVRAAAEASERTVSEFCREAIAEKITNGSNPKNEMVDLSPQISELMNTITGLSNQLNTVSKYVIATAGKISGIESQLKSISVDAHTANLSATYSAISQVHHNQSSPFLAQISADYEDHVAKNGDPYATPQVTGGTK